jgi:tetratricopeptide (TPR) repeat protein
MNKRYVLSVLMIFIFNGSLFSQINEPKVVNMTMYSKIISALDHWDMKSAVDELKVLSKTENPEDEPYFYFFKASITYYTWVQVDSIQESPVLSNIDSAVKYFERALIGNPRIAIPQLYIKSSQDGLDSCANIINQRAKMNFLQEDYLKAMNLYDKILDFSNNPVYLTGAGLTALKVTSFYKAENCFLRAIQYSPKYEKARFGLCETYKRLNDSIKGINAAKDAVLIDSLNKNYLINYYNISAYFKNKDEMKQAIAKLEPYATADQNICSIVANHYILWKDFPRAESYLLTIASKQRENEANATKLKFYYNWFLSLCSYNSLSSDKANSIGFCKKWIGDRMLIRQKAGKLLLINTENAQLQGIIEFLKKELE